MRVIIIGKFPFPNGMAPAKRVESYAKALLSAGIDCEVVVYTRTERYGLTPNNTVGRGVYQGIPFRYIGGTPLRGSNLFIRQWNDRLDKLHLMLYLRKTLRAGDIVFGYVGTDVRYINRLIRLIHRRGAKYIRELCELPYGTGRETSSALRLRHITLKKQFPLCDGIVCISDTLYHLAQEYAAKGCRLIKIPILVDYNAYRLDDLSHEVAEPYIFHSGTLLEQKDGILGMIEAFGLAVQKTTIPLRFISTGNIDASPHAYELRRLIAKYALQDRVLFTGYLSEEELKGSLSRASLVLINKYDTQQNHYCFSTKLAEYLAAAKAVIITNVGEAMNWLKDRQTAYIVEQGNTAALADTIVEALENVEQRQRIATNGQILCSQAFDYKHYSDKLKQYLSDMELDYA